MRSTKLHQNNSDIVHIDVLIHPNLTQIHERGSWRKSRIQFQFQSLTLSGQNQQTTGKLAIFFFFFFQKIVLDSSCKWSPRNNLHEISLPTFWKIIRKWFQMSSADFLPSLQSAKSNVCYWKWMSKWSFTQRIFAQINTVFLHELSVATLEWLRMSTQLCSKTLHRGFRTIWKVSVAYFQAQVFQVKYSSLLFWSEKLYYKVIFFRCLFKCPFNYCQKNISTDTTQRAHDVYTTSH